MKELTIDDLPASKMDEWWREHDDEYYHYLYRIDNTENKMFYYGIHSQRKDSGLLPENDGYMGSGTALMRAQKKHGMDKFTKTVLKVFSTRDEARLEEMKIVDDSLVKDRKCYNLTIGGGSAPAGMGTYVNKDNPNDIRYLSTNDPLVLSKQFIGISTGKAIYKNKENSNDIRRLSVDDPLVLSGQFIGVMKGIKQSEEIILKKTGNKNGSWNTVWITNGIDTKKIKKSDKIPDGWKLGRSDHHPTECINIDTKEHKWFKNIETIDETVWKPSILFIKEKIIQPDELIDLYNIVGNWKKVAENLGISPKKLGRMKTYYKKQGYIFPSKK